MCLGAEGDLRAECVEFAFADRGNEGGHSVFEIGLSPGPSTAQGFVVGEPGDGPNRSVCNGGGVDIEYRALVEIDVGYRAHAPGRLRGAVEADAKDAAGDI